MSTPIRRHLSLHCASIWPLLFQAIPGYRAKGATGRPGVREHVPRSEWHYVSGARGNPITRDSSIPDGYWRSGTFCVPICRAYGTQIMEQREHRFKKSGNPRYQPAQLCS
jgi:hypothetical protein